MPEWLQLVVILALAYQIKAMHCVIGQEPDPASHGRYRWVIPVLDPCRCTEVQIGGMNTLAPHRPFEVVYFDTFLQSSNPVEIRKWFNCTDLPVSCRSYMELGRSYGDGFYKISPLCGSPIEEPLEVYCDQTSNGGGWMRFYFKSGPRTCFKYDFNWTGEMIGCLGIHNLTGFAVSDNETTIDTEMSWVLTNGSWDFALYSESTSGNSHVSNSLQIPNSDVIADLANCKTPTGVAWSTDYQGGYAKIEGTLSTNGQWTSMYDGCPAYPNKFVGETVSFRFGGVSENTGEFVHTHCKPYKIDQNNSITSLWDSDNVRAIWIRP